MCMPPLAGLQQLPPARGPPLRRAGGSNPTWAATTPRVLLRSQARLAMRPLTLPAALLLVWAALEVAATAAQAGGAAQVRIKLAHNCPIAIEALRRHLARTCSCRRRPAATQPIAAHTRCTHPSTVWQQARQAGVTSMPCCTCPCSRPAAACCSRMARLRREGAAAGRAAGSRAATSRSSPSTPTL